MSRSVSSSARWDTAIADLDAEKLKVASYDRPIMERLGDVAGKTWLDYGCGPGVLPKAAQKMGADICAYDINPKMREACGEKIGHGKVFDSINDMRGREFEIITCNLVLCIVTEKTVERISANIRKHLQKDGIALIGFCNPQIFDVPETDLDIRRPTGNTYYEHHTVRKVKKEGGYRIKDEVRPVSWYHDRFYDAGLEQTGLLTTAPYKMPGSDRTIRDFIIFETTRV